MAWLSRGDGWQGPPTSQDPWVWVRGAHLPLPSHLPLLHPSLGCWQLSSFCFSFIPQMLGLPFECKGSTWVSQVKNKEEEPTPISVRCPVSQLAERTLLYLLLLLLLPSACPLGSSSRHPHSGDVFAVKHWRIHRLLYLVYVSETPRDLSSRIPPNRCSSVLFSFSSVDSKELEST